MSSAITTSELIDRLVSESGIKKKLATELMRAIPEIIADGLNSDGEVRVKDFGTFRMKWTQGRTGRNPKTGETVEIPPHNRLVFLPEQAFKEFVNRDNRLLSYKVIPPVEEEAGSRQSAVGSLEEEVEPVQSSKVKVQSVEIEENNLEPETWNLEPGTRSLEPETPSEEIDYSYETEPEQPVRRRRSIHWVVPVTLTVIAVLAVIFYFRNFNPIFRKSEERRPKAYIVTKDDSSERPADTVQSAKFKVQSEKAEAQSEDTTVDTKQQAPNPNSQITQNSELKTPTQNSTLKTPTQNSTLKTQNSEGQHLFQIAREVYGNPFLWVLIYKENLDKIPAPDVVIAGKELVIPALEGKPRKLTHNDSVNVADGYRIVYEYYLDKGDPKAEEFKKTYQSYKPR